MLTEEFLISCFLKGKLENRYYIAANAFRIIIYKNYIFSYKIYMHMNMIIVSVSEFKIIHTILLKMNFHNRKLTCKSLVCIKIVEKELQLTYQTSTTIRYTYYVIIHRRSFLLLFNAAYTTFYVANDAEVHHGVSSYV